jgi:hypothetical protein
MLKPLALQAYQHQKETTRVNGPFLLDCNNAYQAGLLLQATCMCVMKYMPTFLQRSAVCFDFVQDEVMDS